MISFRRTVRSTGAVCWVTGAADGCARPGVHTRNNGNSFVGRGGGGGRGAVTGRPEAEPLGRERLEHAADLVGGRLGRLVAVAVAFDLGNEPQEVPRETRRRIMRRTRRRRRRTR